MNKTAGVYIEHCSCEPDVHVLFIIFIARTQQPRPAVLYDFFKFLRYLFSFRSLAHATSLGTGPGFPVNLIAASQLLGVMNELRSK